MKSAVRIRGSAEGRWSSSPSFLPFSFPFLPLLLQTGGINFGQQRLRKAITLLRYQVSSVCASRSSTRSPNLELTFALVQPPSFSSLPLSKEASFVSSTRSLVFIWETIFTASSEQTREAAISALTDVAFGDAIDRSSFLSTPRTSTSSTQRLGGSPGATRLEVTREY